MNHSIELDEQRLRRILTSLAKNPKTQQLACELAEIYNSLLSELSQRDMDNLNLDFMYNDLRDGLIHRMKARENNKELCRLLNKIKSLN